MLSEYIIGYNHKIQKSLRWGHHAESGDLRDLDDWILDCVGGNSGKLGHSECESLRRWRWSAIVDAMGAVKHRGWQSCAKRAPEERLLQPKASR